MSFRQKVRYRKWHNKLTLLVEMIDCAILTVSDGVAAGAREDLSGDKLATLLDKKMYRLVARANVPDEFNLIAAQLREWCAVDTIELVLTTGGTGLAPRDVTPQATRAVGDFAVEGIGELMRAKTIGKTKNATLSRAGAVVRDGTLIINFPGSPKGVSEMFGAVKGVLPHAVEMMRGGGH